MPDIRGNPGSHRDTSIRAHTPFAVLATTETLTCDSFRVRLHALPFPPGSLEVNSRQGGGTKGTWVNTARLHLLQRHLLPITPLVTELVHTGLVAPVQSVGTTEDALQWF